tara:strand:+ start:57 stop:404 length:348 start_codon:yes stop_codon:yes gene_type:complete
MKILIFLFSLIFFSTSFAFEKNFLCKSEDKDLVDQKFSVNFKKKTVEMSDERKIFEIKINKDEIGFKKAFSIRNLDSLTSKNPKFFSYNLNLNSYVLEIFISSTPTEKYLFSCSF